MALDTEEKNVGSKKKKKKGAYGKIIVADRYEVDPNVPLPEYDMPPSLAYECNDLNANLHCVAIVCDPKMPLRLGDLKNYQSIEHAGLQRIYHFGSIEWEPESRDCPILIAENPRGKRIFKALDHVIDPIEEEDILIRFMRPAIRYLRMTREHEFTHRAIRPTNLFYGDENRTKIILGEPISSLPAINQPFVCEPIESCLTSPAGRGHGSPADDIYALAVTFMSLLIGHLPCRGMSNEEILKGKSTIGSYQTIVGDMEFSRMAFEMFHGCLEDKPSSRWRIEELSEWIGGKHFPLRRRPTPTKSARPIVLNESEYFNPKILAQGIADNWNASKEVIINGDIEVWLRRYVADSEFSLNLGKAKANMNPDINANQDRLLLRSIVALDPRGPIRIGDLSAMVGGFGGVLAFYKGNQSIENAVLQVIAADIVSFWAELYPDNIQPFHRSINRIEDVRREHRINRFGGGIESYRYFLNNGLNCLSPILENYYVFDIPSLLSAFEKISTHHPEHLKNTIIDREIAAFIANRSKRDIRSDIQVIESAADPDQGRIQQIHILALLQESCPDLSLPAFCKVSADFLKPTLGRLHGMQNRRKLYNRMLSIAKIGVLAEIISAINDDNEINQDVTGFEIAKAEFRQVTSTIKKLEELIQQRSEDAKATGGKVAAGVSGIVSCVLAISIIFYIEVL